MRAARLAALAAGAAAMGTTSRRNDAQASSADDPSESVTSTKDPRGGAVTFGPAPPPAAHPGARLAFVQVLTRHGDRTSINPLPFETKDQWSNLLLSEDEQAALASRAAPFPANPALLDARRENADGEDISWHGQLTKQGVAQLVHTGVALRAWLASAGLGLPPSRADAVASSAVKIRSTGTRRTVQSAQAMMAGLYPNSEDIGGSGGILGGNGILGDGINANALAAAFRSAEPASASFPIEVRDRFRESMFPNPGMACARQTELMRALDGDTLVLDAEARAWESEALRAVRAEVHERNVSRRRREKEKRREQEKAAEMAEAVEAPAGTSDAERVVGEGESSVASVAEPSVFTKTTGGSSTSRVPSSSRLPSATSVWEPLQARLNHGLALPKGVTSRDVARIREAAEVRYVNRATNAEGAALAGGRLLRELAEESHDVVVASANGGGDDDVSQRKKSLKLSVFSGHDSSILALLAVLGAFPGEWPPVASTVLVETWLVDERVAGARVPGVGRPHWSERTISSASSGSSTSGEVLASDDADPRRSGFHSRGETKAMVRVLFNSAVLPLAGCAGQEDAKKGGLCSLAAFREMARRRDPEDYKKACAPREPHARL